MSVANELSESGFATKNWTSKNGNTHGGKQLTQKYIHGILTNQLYIGRITHSRNDKTEVYDGRHKPIIEQDTWGAAQQIMRKQNKSELHRWTHPHLLKGKIRTLDGYMMSPSSTHRPLTKKADTKQKRLVRYYLSQKAVKHGFKNCPIKSLNAEHIDQLIRGLVLGYLDHDEIIKQTPVVRDRWIRNVIEEVTIATDSVMISLIAAEIDTLRSHRFKSSNEESLPYPTCLHKPVIEDCGKTISLTLSIQIKKLDGRRLLLSPEGTDLIISSQPEPQQHIVDAIGLAYRWHDELIKSGMKIEAFAKQHRMSRTRVRKLLPLTQLGPDVIRHALIGTLPSLVTLDDLITASHQLDWMKQASELGLKSVG